MQRQKSQDKNFISLCLLVLIPASLHPGFSVQIKVDKLQTMGQL